MPGYLLKRKHPEQESENEDVMYYYASNNTSVLDGFRIKTAADLHDAIQRLRDLDVEVELSQDRPNTGYFFYKVTNVLFEIYKQPEHLMGHPTNPTPDPEVEAYVNRSRSVITRFRGQGVDSLCFFRCLAYHKTQSDRVEREAKSLLERWGRFKGKRFDPVTFPGVRLEEIPEQESCFQINIRIYSIEKKQPIQAETEQPPQPNIKFAAYCVQNSMGRFQDNINLHLLGEHLSYISKINSYAKSWLCPYCKRFFASKRHMQRHVKEMRCAEIQYKYPGGGFGLKPNIFDKLNMHGIHVAPDRRFYELRAGFDFECRFLPLPGNGSRLQFLQRLIPASFRLSSNVPGFTDVHCFRNRDPEQLVKQFITYLEDISKKAREIMEERYADVIVELKNRTRGISNLREALSEATDPIERKALKREIKNREIYENLQQQFNMWLRRLVVLGFNSGKFDLNLIKDHLVKHFIRTRRPGEISVIKRGNSFMSISSDDLVFLDMTNYLGPAVSYDKFIKAYGVSQTKGIWPYEWFVDYDLLKQDHLPPREAFYCILRQKGISEEEYERAKETWRTNGFQTMEDMLVWYNNLDTVPMLEAIKKMWDNFKAMGLEMFKSGAISLPGLAMQHLFAKVSPIECFALFGPKDKHWDEIVRNNIVGGPSIVFTRYHAAGETVIRGLTKIAQAVLGYDANAFYLWATGQAMPVGIPTFYDPDGEAPHSIPFNPTNETRASIETKIQQNLRTPLMRKWTWGQKELNYVTWTFGKYQHQNPNLTLTLRHKHGGGQMSFHNGEKDIFVDGYIPELDTILQFHGCYFHGHSCMRGRMDEELRLEKEAKTETIREFLRSTGKTLVECYECEFKKEQDSTPALAAYIRTFRHGYLDNPTGAKILRQMQQDNFFGLVECDLQVPWWVPGLRDTMDEMAPVFKNVKISRDDLDADMKQFAIDQKIMSQPRRTLIGSFFGEKILVATPLLKWYLKHGLVVTRVYRAAQYRPSTVFRHLADEVTSHRSAADREPNKKVLAEMYKLLGNSYYGKCLTNKLKQSDISYMSEEKAGRAINEATFQSLEEVADGVYEVASKKSKIEFDLPTLIAFFVYSYSKQRMLQFYYDFLDQILDRTDFEMIEMDTAKLDATDAGTFVNNIGYALFDSVDVSVTDQKVTKTESLYPWWTYLYNLMYYSKTATMTHLETGNLWIPDDPGYFDDVDLLAEGRKNQGMKDRQSVCGDSKKIWLCTKVLLNTQLDRLLPSQTEIGLKFNRSPTNMCLLGEDSKEYKIRIVDAKLHVNRVKLYEPAQRELEKVLHTQGFYYPGTNPVMRSKTVSKGDQNVDWTPFTGKLPQRIYLVMIGQDAYNGKLSKNPYNFKSFGISNLQVYNNGRCLPYGQGLTKLSDSNPYLKYYMTTLQSINSPETFNIGYGDYDQGNFIVAVDVSADFSAGCDYNKIDEYGSLRLAIDFEKPLSEAITILCLGEVQETLKIDADRNPSFL